jgi:protein-tyrosine-phosphatase
MKIPMKKRVLFLCTGNSARSQIAEAPLKKQGGEYFDVFSAGTSPGHRSADDRDARCSI